MTSCRWSSAANPRTRPANSPRAARSSSSSRVDQHAHRHQRRRPARQRRDLVAQRAQHRDLHLAVLVAAEHVLEGLQRLDHRLDDLGGRTAARRTARAGSGAPCPSCAARGSPRRRAVTRRSRGPSSPSAGRPCGSARRTARRSAASRPGGRRPASRSRPVEQRTPVATQRRRPRRSEARAPSARCAVSRRAAQHAPAADRGRRASPPARARASIVELEHVHVEVADVAGRPAAASGTPPGSRASSSGGNTRACSSRWTERERRTRHAQIVQELGVDVGDRALEVRLDHLEQPAQHGDGGRVGRAPRA